MHTLTPRRIRSAPSIQSVRPPDERRPPCDIRSLCFVRPDRIETKLAKIKGRSLILDLEDGVPREMKSEQRIRISTLLRNGALAGRDVLIRINGLDDGSQGVEADLRECLLPGLHGLILPMLRNAEQVRLFDALVLAAERAQGLPAGTVAFYPLIEHVEGLVNAVEIARASPRVRALCFGHADFLLSHIGDPSSAALQGALNDLVLAASATRVPAVASPFLDLRNERGFRNYCREMRELGFSGVFSLNPTQDTLARSIFSVTALEAAMARAILNRDEKGAISVRGGQMVGPPMIARAKRRLERANTPSRPIEDPVTGRLARYGLDLETVYPGQVLVSPHELTIDDSWRTAWLSSFPTSNRLVTSAPFAKAWGLPDRALPTGLLLNLTLCMSVEPFSQSCRLHLGLRDAVQLAPAVAGDTFRNIISIDKVRNTSRGDASVIQSTHVLLNQKDEVVYRLTKMSYFDAVVDLESRSASPENNAFSVDDRVVATTVDEHIRAAVEPPTAPNSPLETGDVLLHPAVRPIGWSENLLLTTMFKNTHPVHFDAERYARDEIIVCGGFVQSMALALSESELRQVLGERLIYSAHINTVAPEDRLGAISRVLSVQKVSAHLEEVKVQTLGLRNVDVERELVDLPLPGRLFDEAPRKPSLVEEICRQERPELEGRIALQATRVLLRPR